MALVQAINTAQIQARIDAFANEFLALEQMAEDLVAAKANLTQANVDARLVLGDDGNPMNAATLTELNARLQAMQTFITWATTGSPSPVAYLRGVKRTF